MAVSDRLMNEIMLGILIEQETGRQDLDCAKRPIRYTPGLSRTGRAGLLRPTSIYLDRGRGVS